MSQLQCQRYPVHQTIEESIKLSQHLIPPNFHIPSNNQRSVVETGLYSKVIKKGFTVLEVLVALSILVLTLMALYQSFSTSIYVLSSTTNLWKAMSYAQNELLKSERSNSAPPVSFSKGVFELEHAMYGFAWEKNVSDTTPLPGIIVRQVNYQLLWNKGKNTYTYDADIYVKRE